MIKFKSYINILQVNLEFHTYFSILSIIFTKAPKFYKLKIRGVYGEMENTNYSTKISYT